MDFCKRLTYLRRSRGLNQAELAEQLCISRSSLSLYECGKRDPSIDTLIQMADYFQVSTDYLLGRSDTPAMSVDLLSKRSPNEMLTLIELLIKHHKKNH